ncbi:unnamed protein product, partial [Mesorhabditis spiculigera]
MSPPCSNNLPPSLDTVTHLAVAIGEYLGNEKRGVVVFYGVEENCILLATVLLLYCKMYSRSYQCFEAIRSNYPQELPHLPPSYHAILDTIALVANRDPAEIVQKLNTRVVSLKSLSLSPIPAMNRSQTGCRPVVEVFNAGKKIYATAQQYEDAGECLVDQGYAKLELRGMLVNDAVTVVVSHARHSSMHGTMSLVPMFIIHLEVRFLDGKTASIALPKGQLDVHKDALEHIDENFKATLLFDYKSENTNKLPAALNYEAQLAKPTLLFFDNKEYETFYQMCDRSSTELPDFPSLPGYASISGASAAPRRPPVPKAAEKKPLPKTEQPKGEFFSSLFDGAPAAAPQPSASHMPDFDFGAVESAPKKRVDDAEMHERMAGIRVGGDPEDETPIFHDETYAPMPGPAKAADDFDLLGLSDHNGGVAASSKPSTSPANTNPFDPFGDLLGGGAAAPSHSQPQMTSGKTDLLDWGPAAQPTQPIHRNSSAPAFKPQPAAFDPFADFMASSTSKPASGPNSGRNTPSTQQQQQPQAARPNYSRSAFEDLNAKPKAKPGAANFDDLLSGHNFTSSVANKNRTMGDMKKEVENLSMDPVSIKIRDWTSGKQGNIRALLCSLNDVLWEGASRWDQPSMGMLFEANDVKKQYRKACLVVHPDKQTGQPHHELAKAIFTELNKGWKAFEQAEAQ